MFIYPYDSTKTCGLQAQHAHGIVQWRAGHENGHSPGMGRKKTDPRRSPTVAVLAENVQALLDRPGAPYPNPNALAAVAAISRPTVHGLLDRTRAVGVDKLDVLAKALGVPAAWQLLVPGQFPTQKAAGKKPKRGRFKTTESGTDFLQSMSTVPQRSRGARPLDEAPDDVLPSRANGIGSDRTRPKGGKKVAKTVKARTRP